MWLECGEQGRKRHGKQLLNGVRLCEPGLGVFKFYSKSSEMSLESFKQESDNSIYIFRKSILPLVEWAVGGKLQWIG